MEWALSDQTHDWIRKNFPAGSIILELGSGDGSAILAEDYVVYSIEHDREWVNKHKKVNYIYAPIKKHKQIKGFDKNEWYDKDVIYRTKEISYDMIIVDGPPGSIGRQGTLKYLNLFHRVPMLFDDYHRHWERKLAHKVAARLGGELFIFGLNTTKHVAVCWPGKKWYAK